MGPDTIGKTVHLRVGGTDEAPVIRAGRVVVVREGGKKLGLRIDLDAHDKPLIDSSLHVTEQEIKNGFMDRDALHGGNGTTWKVGTWAWPGW